MNRLRRRMIVLFTLACTAPACFGQALVEYAAGAAVGAAGSAGGKAVSSALDRVFKQTDAALTPKETKQPAAPGEQRKKTQAAAATAAAASSIPTAARVPSRRHSRPAIAGTVVSVTQQSFEPPASPAPPQPVDPLPVVVTAADFSRIAPGASRQDLLTHVGQPAYRVRISGDGHVQEFYRYSSGGVDLGTVRVTDGTVTAVRPRNN